MCSMYLLHFNFQGYSKFPLVALVLINFQGFLYALASSVSQCKFSGHEDLGRIRLNKC